MSSPCRSCFEPVAHSSYLCHFCFEPVAEKMAQMDQNYQNAKMAQVAHSTPEKSETARTVGLLSVSTDSVSTQ